MRMRAGLKISLLIILALCLVCSGFSPIGMRSTGNRLKMTCSNDDVVPCRFNLLRRMQETASILLVSTLSISPINPSYAKEKPTLEQYFRVLEKETTEKPSLTRLTQDVEDEKWDDVKKFTREFGEGFKNAVLKEISKQLPEGKKEVAKKLSETFLQDVIQVNKASRVQNKEDALKALQSVEKDLNQFFLLKDGDGRTQ